MSFENEPDIAEQLSALADGELDPERSRFLLRRLEADESLRASWERMHLARACFKREVTVLLRRDFAAGVAAAVAAEPVPRRGVTVVARVGRWVAGGAVAASVALFALVLVAPQPTQPTQASRPLAASDAALPVPVFGPPEVAPSSLRESDLRPSLAAQTAAAARRSGVGGTLGPVAVAQPLYLPHYLVRQPVRDGSIALRRDAQGDWVMVQTLQATTSTAENPPER